MKFEIKDRDAAGRICKYTTKHGIVTTPNLMPVINPNKMIISPKEMKKLFGTEIVITNAYIIKKEKQLREKALLEGVHNLIDFNGPIMTDSGTFQSYVYGNIKLDPVEIVKFQRDIGSDIGTILDVFGTPDQTKKEIEEGMQETIKRAKLSVKVKGDMALACTIQGSVFSDLREICAKQISSIDADFYPIGGVVPLMESQRYTDLVKSIIYSKKGLNPSKPVHLFGAGHPIIFPLAVALGCDFFDSSAYIKYAKDERIIFPWGTEKLQDLEEIPCNCPVCSKYSASELKKLEKKQRTLEIAKHNLYISYTEIKKIKNAIRNGNLWELVERKASYNPYLLEAMNELKKDNNKRWLEQFEPISKNKALFYTGNQTIHRPIVYRLHNRLIERYQPMFKSSIVFPEGNKPYSSFYKEEISKITNKKNVNIIIKSNIGPSPIELDEMYPFAQSVFPKSIDEETEKYIRLIFEKITKNMDNYYWNGNKTLTELKNTEKRTYNKDICRISSVLEMQFGIGASKALLKEDIKIVKSKKTKKIRNIYSNNKHILSMRATDGMFTLKKEGAKLLHKHFRSPNLRVIVDDDAAEYVKKGKSVFSKFIIDSDPNLRPMDECLIVDKKDNLLANGRCLLNKFEMTNFEYGMAVKTREKI